MLNLALLCAKEKKIPNHQFKKFCSLVLDFFVIVGISCIFLSRFTLFLE